MSKRLEDLTIMLNQFSAGKEEIFDQLMPDLYEKLNKMAMYQLRRERHDHTLNESDLVHEAYLRLRKLRDVEWEDRGHFYAVASRTMRHVLINYAAKKNTQKRGGGSQDLPFDDMLYIPDERTETLLALDEALRRLEKVNSRHALVVECRFFGGLSIDETGVTVGISPATVKRDWKAALLWLTTDLKSDL